jgi:hypothetical protein
MASNVYCLEVEEWSLIAPITRDYTYKKSEESRIFYPKNYLDQFDIDKGDYFLDGK